MPRRKNNDLLMKVSSPQEVLFYYRSGLSGDPYLREHIEAFKKMIPEDQLELLFVMSAVQGRALGSIAQAIGAQFETVSVPGPEGEPN